VVTSMDGNQDQEAYSLHALVLEKNPDLPLSKEDFHKFRKAKSCLNSALALEENYDILISNYRELEIETLSMAVSDMTVMKHEHEDFFDIRKSLNRRTINLLTATRMYLDQYPKHIKRIGIDPTEIKKVASKSYDDFFEYRFMEALRNHAQHSGLAVHGITAGGRWLPKPEAKKLEFSMTPYALKSALEGSSFKKSVLSECPEKIAILHAARIHIGGISAVHKKARELTFESVKEARSLFQDAISRHEIEAKKRYPGLSAIMKVNGSVIEKIPLLLEWDDIRKRLTERNYPIENLAKRFVTSHHDEQTPL